MNQQLSLGFLLPSKNPTVLDSFRAAGEGGQITREISIPCASRPDADTVPGLVNEFWTARQRQASSLQEISYRACFKPQLPRFFIERLTRAGDVVYDPFMGRGTTLVEAALLGRVPVGTDINPLSRVMAGARLAPPEYAAVQRRLAEIDLERPSSNPPDLLVFYHPDTLRMIGALRLYFAERRAAGKLDDIDLWLEMVCLNRLTGHSPGFFSVYTLPPNQAVSVVSQRKINEKRQQTPPPRDVPAVILKKSRQLLRDVTAETRATLRKVAKGSRLLTAAAESTPELSDASVDLVVTSPPFLDVVNYATDNWLRCWFLGIDPAAVKLTVPKKLDLWAEAMTHVFHELHRVVKPGGHVAFEVGEVRGGSVRLEETVLPCGIAAGLDPELVLINDQEFTKTANCWGVDNNTMGTNTNRIVLFRRP